VAWGHTRWPAGKHAPTVTQNPELEEQLHSAQPRQWWESQQRLTVRSLYWYLRRAGWPLSRIGLHPKHKEGLYARVALLPPPFEGLFAIPRVHVLEAKSSSGDGLDEGDSNGYDPSSQCSVWSEHFDPASGRHYYNHLHTGESVATASRWQCLPASYRALGQCLAHIRTASAPSCARGALVRWSETEEPPASWTHGRTRLSLLLRGPLGRDAQ
jgi:hypothetical protein